MLLTIFYGHLNDAINHHIKQLMMHLKMLNFRKFINRVVIRSEMCVFVCRRLRLLAQRSEYFRSELTSLNHQTFFLPNDQAFASFGSGLSFLFDQTTSENTNDINDVNYFVKQNKKDQFFLLFAVYSIAYYSDCHVSNCNGCSKASQHAKSRQMGDFQKTSTNKSSRFR